MKTRKRAQILAAMGAIATFAALLFVLKLRGWAPLIAGVFSYFALLMLLWPQSSRTRANELPNGINRADFELALERLGIGAERLRAYQADVPPADAPLFERMADLLDQIRSHHLANPSHTRQTRSFIRHSLKRIIEAVSDYVALVRRAGDDQRDRLAEISRSLEAFVPVLEKIDQACVENDLVALEINIEVLNEQLDRKR